MNPDTPNSAPMAQQPAIIYPHRTAGRSSNTELRALKSGTRKPKDGARIQRKNLRRPALGNLDLRPTAFGLVSAWPVRISHWALCAGLAVVLASTSGCRSPQEHSADSNHRQPASPAGPASSPHAPGAAATPSPTQAGAATLYPIDLPTALRLARAQNHQIALARERIQQAHAQQDEANVLLLPTVSAGLSYHYHEGRIQQTSGTVLDVERNSGYAGLGAGASGTGEPQVPGLSIATDLADAIFEPLAARQHSAAVEAGSRVTENRTLLEVSLGYLELQRSKGTLAIAEETQQHLTELAQLTATYARSGEGLEADAQRAAVEALAAEQNLEKTRETFEADSVRLARLLRLDAQTRLNPAEERPVALSLVETNQLLSDLLASAFAARPEVEQNDALVQEATQRLRQAKYDPLIPKAAVRFSGGGFGGGTGTDFENSGGRTDVSALLFWQLENLGLGYRAQARVRRSELNQRRIEQRELLDRIAAEVVEAWSQVQTRSRRLATAGKAVQQALRSYDLNRERIHQRQGLPLEVLQSIHSLATARQLLLDAVIDYDQAQFRIYHALGLPPTDAAR